MSDPPKVHPSRKPLNDEAFATAAARLGCEFAAIKAVAEVEAAGSGFNPDGSPKTLFEAHHFHRLTRGRFGATHPHLSAPRWDRTLYGRTWQEEQARLAEAESLDLDAAHQSASWGRFQVMGFNWQACGYHSLAEFVADMRASEAGHLRAFVGFILDRGLADELRDRRWADFARLYNGPGYAANRYDEKMAAAYRKHAGAAPPPPATLPPPSAFRPPPPEDSAEDLNARELARVTGQGVGPG